MFCSWWINLVAFRFTCYCSHFPYYQKFYFSSQDPYILTISTINNPLKTCRYDSVSTLQSLKLKHRSVITIFLSRLMDSAHHRWGLGEGSYLILCIFLMKPGDVSVVYLLWQHCLLSCHTVINVRTVALTGLDANHCYKLNQDSFVSSGCHKKTNGEWGQK